MQSRIESAIESFVNITIGYFVAIMSQIIVFPIFDIHVSMQTNLLIGAWFTCISLVRSYVVRRFFNLRIMNKSMPAPAATLKGGGRLPGTQQGAGANQWGE